MKWKKRFCFWNKSGRIFSEQKREVFLQETERFMIGFIGYGDAAQAIAKGLHEETGIGEMRAWSVVLDGAEQPDEHGVLVYGTLEELIGNADLLFALVPGAAAIDVARKSAAFLKPDQLYVDLTTSSPTDMKQVEKIIKATGAKFADGAMMDTVPKHNHRVPITLCGPDVTEAEEKMKAIGMRIDALGEETGKADAVKLLRSMYTKAHLACVFEMLEAAEHFGVAEYVMDGLAVTMDSETFHQGMDKRVAGGVIHAERRSHELACAADMLEQEGFSALMSRAGSEKLKQVGKLDIRNHLTHGRPATWQEALRYLVERRAEWI